MKLFLETRQADLGIKDGVGRTLLALAAGGGHEAMVKLLPETSQVDVDLKDRLDRTPLSGLCSVGMRPW